MANVLTAVGNVFSYMFNPTGEGAVAWVTQLIRVITANDYLLIGVSLMIIGSVIGFLSRLIHST